MQGVTTALVTFLFVCVVFPNLVKNKAQYYAALGAVCLIIALDAVGMMVGEKPAFRVLVYVFGAALQVTAILLLFLAAGGITWRELAGDMKDAYEVIRRGKEEKEIIIPLSGEFARQQSSRMSADDAGSNRDATEPPSS